MTDEDIRQMVREFKSFVSKEMEEVREQMNSIHARMDSMESGIMNELKDHGRRIVRLEKRML